MKVYKSINDSLRVTTLVADFFTTFAVSTPIAIYFLGFLNYFTLTSLYLLLNYQLPEHIFKYLAIVYDNVQSDLMTIANVNL